MSPPTRKRVEEAIREVGYVSNHAAKALKTSRTGLVATITPSLSNPVSTRRYVVCRMLVRFHAAAEETISIFQQRGSRRLRPRRRP